MQHADEIIYDKLFELSVEYPQISLQILRENNLANKMVLTLLFEEMDTITLQEAISLTSDRLEKRKIWRRKKKAFDLSNRYRPCTLITDLSQYYLILQRRDEYILKQEVINRLGISKTTLYRLLNMKGISRGPYISIEDYNNIADYITKTNKVSIKEVMNKMKIKKTRAYELAKAAGVSLVSGFITQDEFKKMRKKYEELKIKSALNTLMNRGYCPSQFE